MQWDTPGRKEGSPPYDSAKDLVDAIIEAARLARIGVAVTVLDGPAPKNLFLSEALLNILGRTAADLDRASPASLVAPEDVARLRAIYADRQAGGEGPVKYEITIVRPGGERTPVAVSSTTIPYGTQRASVVFVQDISRERRAEESFQRLVDAALEPIVIVRGGELAHANHAAARVFACEGLSELHAIFPRPLLDAMNVHERVGESTAGIVIPEHAFRTQRRDGSEIILESTALAIRYQDQPAVVAILRDVTERRRLEAQLLQADRLAALGTLAAGVAHEINNPLAYMQLALEWVERRLPDLVGQPQLLPELSSMLKEAREGAVRVGAIVRDLRDFSLADGETRGPVDLRTATANAIRISAHEVRHRARVETDYDDDVPLVWANEARMEQVLLNLLVNAAHAMPEPKGPNAEIHVRVHAHPPNHVRVEVQDNGAGIPPEALRRVFDPFYTTKPVGRGTGLGLSICHTIVTSIGGEISVDSHMGGGTTFRILLPAGPPEYRARGDAQPSPEDESRRSLREPSEPAGSAAQTSMTAPGPTRRARILIVDDEAQITRAMRDLLEGAHEVTTVRSGAEALEVLTRGSRFDVVFCDLMMPNMSGMDLYDQICRSWPEQGRRVVFMTGGAFTPRAAGFLARVENRRIEKPFALATLERAIADVIEESAASAA